MKDLTNPKYKGYTDYTKDRREYLSHNDGAVITCTLDTIAGGVSLHLEGYPHEVIYAGQPIYKKDGLYKPLGFNADSKEVEAIPAGATLVGVAIHTARKSDGTVGVLTQGTVDTRAAAIKYGGQLSAIKAALPHLLFVTD